jgi:hypothetical protein
MTAYLDDQLLELIEDYKVREDQPVRTARRPAGSRILIERWTLPDGESCYSSILDFWLSSLYGFLQDSGSDTRWFEGLAYQSKFEQLLGDSFRSEYWLLQQRLTLPPPETITLETAYRVLNGRLLSYLGTTPDGAYWAGTFGPGYFGD